MRTLSTMLFACIITGALWAQPAISSFTPASGPVGTSVTISGDGFDATPSNNIVYFGTVRAAVSTGSTVSLTVTVPSGATYAPITVTTGGFTAYSAKPFVVTFGALPLFDANMFAGKVDYSLSPSTSPQSLALGDIDGDGRLDLVTANGGTGELKILRNTSTPGGFTSTSFTATDTTYPVGTAPYGLALGDLDSDGDLDIVVSDTVGGKIYVWRNTSAVDTVRSDSTYAFSVGTNPFGVGIADLDGDGHPDVLVALKGADSVAVLRNTLSGGNLSFAQTNHSTGAGSNPVEVRAEYDLDGDAILDVATVNTGNSRISVLQNGSSAPVIVLALWTGGSPLTLGTGSSSFVLVDLDGDTKADIISANQSSGSVSLLRNTNSGSGSVSFAGKVDIGAGTNPVKIALADLDGDGKPDVVVSNKSEDSVSVLRNTALEGAFSTSTFSSFVQYATGDGPGGMALGDVDGDGKPEILTANEASGDVSVLRNKAIRQVAEAGNDSTYAVLMDIGETIQSVVTSGSDVDYYRFTMNPGDTVVIEGGAVDNGGLYFGFEIYDANGGQYKNRYEFLDETHQYYVFAPNVFVPTDFFVRVMSVYDNGTYFPNSKSPTPEPQMVPGSTAAQDSGFYQLSIERFVPSAPRVHYYSDVYSESYNRARWWVEFYPNALPTSASIEYSAAADLSGSTINPATWPDTVAIMRVNFDSPLTGLSPNTHYYFRGIVTNSAGTAQTAIYEFNTPPAPVGWTHHFVGNPNTITGISYASDTVGVAVGYGGLKRRTTNSGINWNTFPDPAAGQNLYSVWMVNSFFGYAVGSNESIAKTIDGGANWTAQTNTSTGYDLWKVRFINQNAGVAVGSGGLIIKTTNGGGVWTKVRQTDGYQLSGVDYADPSTIVAVGYGGTILRSQNGGTTWDSIPKDPSWPTSLMGIDFPTSSTGYIVGGGILKSTDAGLTWNVVDLSSQNLYPPSLYDISFKDANNGIIAGDGGWILRTTDGGATWNRQVTGTNTSFRASSYRGRALAVGGDNGLVLGSLDPISESDVGDDIVSAISVKLGDDADASIQQVGDIDHYRLDLLADDTVAVAVVTRDTVYVNGLLELLDSGGTPIAGASNDDFVSGDTTRSRVVYIASAGTYYARYSAPSGGTGNYRIRFRSVSPRPEVPFGGIGSILTLESATISAPVITNNVSTNISFEYGLTTSYEIGSVPAVPSPVAGQQLVTATQTLTGLTGFATYHFRVVADNAYGTTYGPDVTFQTILGTARTELEANNSSGNANTIFIGDTVSGAILSSSDVDYYRFQAAAGDTLEFFSRATGSSEAYLKIEVIDSSASNTIVGNNWMPYQQNLHSVFRIFNTGIYFLRVTYSYYYNSYYPNSVNDQGMPQPAIMPTGTASVDTGSYEIRLKRFASSAPDIQRDPGVASIFSNSAAPSMAVAANGLSTTVSVEYGTTSSYGTTVVDPGPPLQGIETRDVRVPLTGLTPNTTYHFRGKAENSAGISYTKEDVIFTTPPAPDGWSHFTAPTLERLENIAAASDSIVVVVYANTIARTSDGGATWTNPTNPGAWMYSVAFGSKDTGLAAGWGINGTTDGGATWTYLGGIPSTYFQALDFASPTVALGAGATYNPSVGYYEASIFRTTDAGQSWTLLKTSPTGEFRAVEILNSDTAFVTGMNYVYRTFNLSATEPAWDSVSVGVNAWFNDLAVIDADHYTVAVETWSNTDQLRRTTDGGASWTPVSLPASTNFRFVKFNGNRGVAGGYNGVICRSIDGGATWFNQASGTYNYLHAAGYTGRYIYVSGDYGSILKYADPFEETEPNDNTAAANPFAMGEQMEGSIGFSGDLDFYGFTVSADDTVEILLSPLGGSPVNGALQLLASDGTTLLEQNDDFVQGDSSTSRIVRIATAGSYFIRVSGSTPGSTGTYLLKLRETDLTPVITAVGVQVTATMASITAQVDPKNLPTAVKVHYGLTTSYTDSVLVDQSPFGQQRVAITKTLTGLTENTDYHFRIVAVNSAAIASSVDSTFHTPHASAFAELEPNDSALAAQLVMYGDSVNGSIDTLTDIDYYRLHIDAGDTVEVFASRRGSSGLYSYLSFYDSSNGGWMWGGWDIWPDVSSSHYVLQTSSTSTLNIRYVGSANPGSYPNGQSEGTPPSFEGSKPHAAAPARPDDPADVSEGPVFVPSSVGAAATSDTGEYRLYVRRFQPGEPEVGSSYPFSRHWNSAMFEGPMRPNGLPSTFTFQYGITTAYGSQTDALNGPWSDLYTNYRRSGEVTGLLPNTTYHVRSIATNSSGADTSDDNSWTTPPVPEGWSRQVTGTLEGFRGASFPTSTTGYITAGYEGVLKTTDAGISWQLQTGLVNYLYSIDFTDALNGVVVGSSGDVYWTVDGGTTWPAGNSNTTESLFGVDKLGTYEAVAVGGGGTITRSTDGGASWSVVQTGKSYHLNNVRFAPGSDTGYAFVYSPSGMILRTTNKGASWDSLAILDTAGVQIFRSNYDGWFSSGTTGLIVCSGRTVLRTADAGASWRGTTFPQGSTIRSVAFSDALNGLVVENGGYIHRTYDGGATWVRLESGTSNALYGAAFNGRVALAVGDYGTVLRSVGLLAKPVNLVASYSSPQYVNLTWNDISGENGYFVERKTGAGGTYNRFRTLGANAASTADTVTPGRIYYYRVQGFDEIDTTVYSTEDSALVPLLTPANLVATPLSKTQVQLTWQNGADERLGYIIERNTGGSWSAIDTIGDATSYVDSTVVSGTTYNYEIKSYNSEMASPYSSVANATTPGLVATPSNLVSTFADPKFVNISWADNASNEGGYWVEKKVGSGGSYVLLRGTGANSTGTVDTVERGRVYYYRVRGYSPYDTSSYAQEDSALAPLYTPTNLVSSTVSSSSIGLSWQNSPDARTGYRVERKAGAAGSYTEINTIGNLTSFTDNSAGSGTMYYYRIRSYTSELSSEYSNEDSALTALGKPQSIAANPSNVTNGPITISWSGPSGATNAVYSVDAPPSGGTAIQVPLGGNSFVLSIPPTGVRWVFVALQNVEGVTDFAAYDSVQTQYDNVDPVITDQSVLPTIEITGTNVSNPASVNIQASVAKPSGIASLLLPALEYKKTNSVTVTTVPFPNLNGGSLNLANLNSLFLTIGKPNGVEYRITASDVAGNVAATAWKSFTVFVNTPPVSDFVPPAAGTSSDISTLVTNYRLFSVPYDLSDKKPGSFMETIDKGLGPHAKEGVNYYNWRMQRYINATYQDYEDFKSLDVLTPGTAFFLLSREQKTITVGIGNLVKASDMFNNGIQVFQGWNLIGNPFPDDFPADSMFVLAGSIANRAYYDGTGPDGGWYKTAPQINTLKKWEGLAVNVTQNTTLRFKSVPQSSEKEIPPIPMAISAAQAIEGKKEGGWLLRIDAHRSGSAVVDVGNLIGEAPEAKEGYDPFDSFQPPLIPGRSLAVYFKNPDGAMSSDVRPIQTNGSSWDMKVITGDRGSRVKLDVSEVVPLSDLAVEAYLLDIDDHMAHDLREQRNIEFGSKEGVRNFRVVAGSKGYVDSVSTSLGIDLVPQVFMLYQNYPNPFNPETAVRFWLPGSAPVYKVSLKIYNILGQEVSTLIDRDMKAGYYETTFSGRNMASGTYIYRLTVDGGSKETAFSSVKKMVMVK